jgi:HAD superfamily hydrolase (TIGR01549 family)
MSTRPSALTSSTFFTDPGTLQTLIFDVDGTLYKQRPVRHGMLWRIARYYLLHPARGLATLRALKAYREAQEFLRASNRDWNDIGKAQITLASQWTGIREEIVAASVARWMEQEPLDLVARSIREGLSEFLQAAKNHGLRLAVFSDYPATAKLAAMSLTDFFDVVVSAQDPEVQQFKPNTRGIEITLQRLGINKARALYIGDRPDIDIPTATKAGLACVLVGRTRQVSNHCPWLVVSNYHELKRLIWRQ